MLLHGFRPHKKIVGGWARADRKYREEESAKRAAEIDREYHEKWPILSEEESQRLSGLWLAPNNFLGMGKSYNASAGRNGLIHISLAVNPFSPIRTEDLGRHAQDLATRGHLAREQDGFVIEASNFRAGDEKGIYIKATKDDGSHAECVWPTTFPAEDIWELAERFKELVNTSGVN